MGRNVLLRSLMAAFMTMLLGCHSIALPGPGQLAGPAAGAGVAANAVHPGGLTISGRVDFPPIRKTQATADQVVAAATISLIDNTTGITVASGVTNGTGTFTVSLGSYVPGTQAYILEAVKGLASNGSGADAARFRTIMRYQSAKWASCTNATPGVGQIIINAQTTALAIESALDPTNVPPLNTIGKVNISTVPAQFYAPMSFATHPDAEFDGVAADILAFLTADTDPIAAVSAIKPTVSSFQPAATQANGMIRITGSGFSPTLSGNTVTFPLSQVATVWLATSTSLFVSVPAAAQSGTIQVATGRGTVTSGSAFSVLPPAASSQNFGITSFTPNTGLAGTTVTLAGNFGTTQGTVYFNGSSPTAPLFAKILSWSANSIQVEVPVGTQDGRISVSAGGATAISRNDFDSWQGDLGYMTNTYTSSYPGAYTVPNKGYGISVVASTSANVPTYIYAIGGTDNSVGTNGPYTSGNGGFNVFMWTVAADGTLSTARNVGRLNIPRYYSTSVVVGKYLYVIGGYDGQNASTYNSGTGTPMTGPSLRSIERATINSDGTLATVAPQGLPSGTSQAQINTGCAIGTSTQFTLMGYSQANPAGADLLMANGRHHHRSFIGVAGANTYIWNVGGTSNSGGNGRNDWETLIVTPSTGALSTSGTNRSGTLNPGPFAWYGGGAQMIGTGIVISGGMYNGGYWAGSITLPINSTDGSLGSGVAAAGNFKACPSYSSAGSTFGQLTQIGAKVYYTGGYHPSYGYYSEMQIAPVNTTNGQITGAWECASTGAPNTSARNQQYNTSYNDKHVVVAKGGVTRIYSFGGYSASNYIQATEVNPDGSLNRTHAWGSTRDNHYGAAAIQLKDRAWVIGGYRVTDAVYTKASEYYALRDDGIVSPPVTGPSLIKPRAWPMWTKSSTYLYVLGGYNNIGDGVMDTIERAAIDPATGVIGAFVALPNRLNLRNYRGSAITVGDYLYVIGGEHPTFGTLATIERAKINPDGSLGTFEILQDYLPYTTEYHSVRQIGSYLYLLSGSGTIGTTMVLRAQVYPDGDISPFTRMPTSDVTGGAYGGAVEVFGNYLYRCGGNAIRDCYRSFINPDGTLQTWALWQPQGTYILPATTWDYMPRMFYRWKNKAFLLSGQGNGQNIFVGTLR